MAGTAGAAGPGPSTLVSDRVNGVHSDLRTAIAPIQAGPITIQLSSPSHTLEVLEHELQLLAAPDGGEAFTLRARYRGEADLVADLLIGGIQNRLEDHVQVPLQDTVVSGRVEVSREADGYSVTALELPQHVAIEVESQLGGQLELLCRGLAVLAMGSIDCAALSESLGRVNLPLPEAGESYFVAASRLTAEERRQIEAYLNDR